MALKKRGQATIQFLSILISFVFIIYDRKFECLALQSRTLEQKNNEKFVVRLMNLEKSESIIYLPKCCSKDKILNRNGSCIDDADLFIKSLNLEQQIEAKFLKDEEPHINFRLVESRPKCEKREVQQLLSLTHSTAESRKFHLTSSLQLVISPKSEDATNGTEEGESSLILHPSNYCLDWESSDIITVEYCVHGTCHSLSKEKDTSSLESSKNGNGSHINSVHANSSQPSPARSLCLRKCCPPSSAVNMTGFACVKYHTPWQLSPMHSSSASSYGKKKSFSNDGVLLEIPLNDQIPELGPLPVNWHTGLPNCVSSSYEVYADMYDRYYINANGELITEQNGIVVRTPPGEYCFDAVAEWNSESESSKKTSFSWLDATATNSPTNEELPNIDALLFRRQMAVVCFENEESTADEEKMFQGEGFNWRNVYTILTGISSFFLLLTCFVYAILWKDLNLPGWLQFAYAFALLLTFTLLTIAQLWTQKIHDISKSLCRALGYGLHFCFLSCFFWLTSMNLDLWLSFRSNALVRGFGKSRGKRRLFEFCVFSVGFPAAVTLLLFVIDSCSSSKNADGETPHCFLPSSGIGEKACVIDMGQKVAQLHYFYGFVGLLLLVNLVIFVGTLISLRNREKETRIAKQQSTSSADYDRLQLFMRLFLIMGILWIFEVISWTFEYFELDESIRKFFVFTDCLNASQGIAVFLMFVWKRQTWKQLKKKFKSRFGIRSRRPLCRPSYNCTVSSGNTATNGTSTKSSHLSSTKSTDSGRLQSTSTFTQLDAAEAECLSSLPSEMAVK